MLRPIALSTVLLGLGACVTSPVAPDHVLAAVEQIREVEAAFAADADALGIVPAFRRRVGPDAILFLPDPTVVNPLLETADWPGDLDWRPEFVAVSAAGDLAFTSGPSAWTVGGVPDHGYYFTVWKRQADGEWRFLVDGTTAMAENLLELFTFGPEVILPPRGRRAAGDVQTLESELATAAAVDYRATLTALLHPRARVVRARTDPAIGAAAGGALIARGPQAAEMRMIDGGVAESGDLAYAYGEVRWMESGQPARGYFMRVWRRDRDGVWRILFDQMTVRAADE